MTEPGGEPDGELEAGRLLFAGEAAFVRPVARIDDLLSFTGGGVEIAFAGRSNVGKSSLVNALTGRKTLARTSHTPGRTQELNFYDLAGRATVVDMPGYGFAAVAKDKVAAWTRLVRGYLRGRPNLARVYLLIDARRGIRDNDRDVLGLLDTAAVSYQIVLTKADELKPAALDAVSAETRTALARRPAAFPVVAVTSSRTGEGVPELRAAIARLLVERGALPARGTGPA